MTEIMDLVNEMYESLTFNTNETTKAYWKNVRDTIEKSVKNNVEILEILKTNPYILENLFKNGGLKTQKDYDKRYFWNTISDEKVEKVKEWLDEDLKDDKR